MAEPASSYIRAARRGYLLAALLWAAPLEAQGVTGAAISGRVLGPDHAPVEQATVLVTNQSNGGRWRSTSNADGRYFVEDLPVGGPYWLDVQAIGFQPIRWGGVSLKLGQHVVADFTLLTTVVQLEEITVTGADPQFGADRTGPAQIISDSLIALLPIAGRDYTELALLSPQVTRGPHGGLSFAGQHNRYNSIQIDGTNNLDPFGKALSGNGTPGWAVRLTPFTPEAVKELQVISAPFDVRYGSFAGGLINAVTQSGSNQLEGSILGNVSSSDLVGTDESGSRGTEFSRNEFGLTLGAPIVRDRVALFLTADLAREIIPQSVPAPSSDTTGGADSAGVGIRYASLARFQELLRGYGAEPGSFNAGDFHAPTRSLFAKVTAELGVGNRLAVSHNYGHGNVRDGTLGRGRGSYGLSSSGTATPETINSTRLVWQRSFASGFSNRLILARVDDRRTCLPNSRFPFVSLRADESELYAGQAGFCLGLETGHTMWEITDNFAMLAKNHRLVFGIHGERIDMVDDVLPFPGGVWFFNSLDSLERGEVAGYTRDFPAAADSQVTFSVNQIGGYVQDQWLPTPRLTLTAGVRVDVPFVPKAPRTRLVALRDLGVNTSLTPSGHALWSPRLGVNYDVSGRGTTVLRGGTGFFSGHPAYVWFRNVYGTTSTRALRIECEGETAPAFTLDPGNQPTECAEPSPRAAPLAYFDPDFRYPRTLKVALGADQRLPGGIVATLDFLYTRGVNTVEMVDVNLTGPVGTSAGEGGRVLYGTINDSTGDATSSRRTDALRFVTQMRNGSGDRSYSVTAQLEKRFGKVGEVSAAYTYTDSKDRMSMGLDLGGLNAASAAVDVSLEHRELRHSFWERPHKITLVGTFDLPLGFQLGLTYFGMSGTRYTYVALGDPNADGFRPFGDISDDVVYVPRDANDITLTNPEDFADLDRLIGDEPCLRSQRGRLLQRNSCRDAWLNETSASLSKRFRLADRRELEVTADLFNLLSFLDHDWGVVRQTPSDAGNVALLNIVGYDTLNGRGVYELLEVSRRGIDVEASRWRMQLGGTLHF